MDAQLTELIELQKEQNQLLKKYLWRFRFSLITLLLLTTAICCCLGFVIYTQQKGTTIRYPGYAVGPWMSAAPVYPSPPVPSRSPILLDPPRAAPKNPSTPAQGGVFEPIRPQISTEK